MKKKVLLTSLPSSFLDNDRVFPTLGPLYLQSFLTSRGIDSRHTDSLGHIEGSDFVLNDGDKQLIGKHDVIAISSTTPQSECSREILLEAKKQGKVTVIGGPHATHYTEECKKDRPNFIVTGDGEFPLLEIASGRFEPGLETIVLRRVLSRKEMESMPLPLRTKETIGGYTYYLGGDKNKRASTALSSRGCPYQCVFCESAGTPVRYYSPERIGREVEQIVDLGFNGVMFFDDCFSISKNRVQEMSKVLKPFHLERRIDYRVFGHIHNFDEPMAKLLSDMGVIEVGFGFESANQGILNRVKLPRRVTPRVSQLYDAVRTANRNGMSISGFLIAGLPFETPKTLERTEEFIQFLLAEGERNGLENRFDLTIFYPYKGTPLRTKLDRAKAQGKTEKEILSSYGICLEEIDQTAGFYKGRQGASEAGIRTYELSREELAAYRTEIFAKYAPRHKGQVNTEEKG